MKNMREFSIELDIFIIFIMIKSNFSDAYSREYTKIKFNLDDLPLEKTTI